MTRVEDETGTRQGQETSTRVHSTRYEYMDEEHSDEYMDDTIKTRVHSTRNIVTSACTMDNQLVYMSRANAIRANNMSATNMCAVL
jgi:hypothetical protein